MVLPAVGSIGLSAGLSLSQGQGMSRFLGALGSGAQKKGGAQLPHSSVVMVVLVVSGEGMWGEYSDPCLCPAVCFLT